ncbi:hypothetical protein [Psychrobacter sp. FME5]|uniref:hypothetical protein n=1 Tax=Psychrobacter sp. FME5 TaxID=2487706 RepID=UPI0017879DE7|nr:hypothetical protein [Psychrobacter sp. FME5]MBE0444159.1 hypothetical protein [Psychrobacter sp. FME5]
MNYLDLVDEKLSYALSNNKTQVNFKGEMLDFPFSAYLYLKKGSDKLFVVLNGAVSEDYKGRVCYHRWSWSDKFPGSVLFITDPTLLKHADLSLAWYIGNLNSKVDKHIARFVEKVAGYLQTEKIVPYGSSGGGFAAIQLACNIDKYATVAVTINPQVKLSEHRRQPVDKYLESCWPGYDVSLLDSDLSFDALSNFKINVPDIIYIQNTVDKLHYERHFIPFLKGVGFDMNSIGNPISIQTGSIRALVYDHESGHAAEPKELLPEIFQTIDQL